MGLFRILKRAIRVSGPPLPRRSAPQLSRPIPREMRFPVTQPNRPLPPDIVVSGRCWVIDGDTIAIDKLHIRLAGIDAPELDHPWGRQSKWALVALCKGQTVTARIKPEMSYDRVVGECFLPDGRDLAAELVKVGLALDWPKFSGGKYRHLEPVDARKKLWRANLRQSGVMWPTDDMVPATTRPAIQPFSTTAAPRSVPVQRRRTGYPLGWILAAGFLVLLVGCQLVGGSADRDMPAHTRQAAPALASFAVTAQALNVRAEPSAGAHVLAQIDRGTVVTPERMAGRWYGIGLPGGRLGWVHSDFLAPVGE